MSHPSLKIYHKAPYAAISPTRPELSQAGRTVVVTGGNSGIGYAIARAFITASAKRVIILSRRPEIVKSAAAKLAEEAKQLGSGTVVEGRVGNVASLESTAGFWAGLEKDGIFVDVLVLNAAAGGAVAPLLQTGRDGVWADFEANVRSILDFTERFYKQLGNGVASQKVGGSQILILDLYSPLSTVPGQYLFLRELHVGNNGRRAPVVRHDEECGHSSSPADCQGHQTGRHADHQLSAWRRSDRHGTSRRLRRELRYSFRRW